MKVKIGAYGCDGCTEWVEDLTVNEYEFLKRLAEKSKSLSGYDCEAVFKVEKLEDERDLGPGGDGGKYPYGRESWY